MSYFLLLTLKTFKWVIKRHKLWDCIACMIMIMITGVKNMLSLDVPMFVYYGHERLREHAPTG